MSDPVKWDEKLEVPGQSIMKNGIRMIQDVWLEFDEDETSEDVMADLDEKIWQINQAG